MSRPILVKFIDKLLCDSNTTYMVTLSKKTFSKPKAFHFVLCKNNKFSTMTPDSHIVKSVSKEINQNFCEDIPTITVGVNTQGSFRE